VSESNPSDRTERLLNLLFLLMSSTRPVSKATIRESLPAYAASPSVSAFERMFERDKEELRSMGVPIDTVVGDQGAGGIDGYRVRGDEYALPEVSFTPEELTILAVAAQVWEQASLGPAARGALLKLEAAGGVARPDAVGVVTRVTTPEPSFPAFLAASQARRPVTFGYRKPGELEAAPRRLEPWGLVARRGHWYVVGRDRDREAPRVFRLARVVGAVTPDGKDARDGSYDVPPPAVVESLVPGPGDQPDAVATVRVRTGAAASLRRTSAPGRPDPDHPGWDLIEPHYSDAEAFAERLVGHGRAVVVVGPEELRAAVVRRLEVLAAPAAAGATSATGAVR
jgi:proteasome accessory factor B